MGDSISSTCFGPSWCLQLLKMEMAADLLTQELCPMGSAWQPTLLWAAAQGGHDNPSPTRGRRSSEIWTPAIS